MKACTMHNGVGTYGRTVYIILQHFLVPSEKQMGLWENGLEPRR